MKNKIAAFMTGVHVLGNTVLAACLHFLSNVQWKHWFEHVGAIGKAPLALLLLPIVLAVDYLKVAFAAWKIYKDKEATPSNLSHLVIEIIKTALATPVVLGILGAIALPALVGPILFVTAIGIGALYNIALFAIHAWQWQHASSAEEAHKHKLLSIKYCSAALMTTLLAVGLGLVLLGGFAALPLLIIGLTTASVLLYGSIATTVISYKIDQALATNTEGMGLEQAKLLEPLLTQDKKLEGEPVTQSLNVVSPQETPQAPAPVNNPVDVVENTFSFDGMRR